MPQPHEPKCADLSHLPTSSDGSEAEETEPDDAAPVMPDKPMEDADNLVVDLQIGDYVLT